MKWIGSALLPLVPACGQVPAPQTFKPRVVAPGISQVGRIAHPAIRESSGVLASRVAGQFWTHNDGPGLTPSLFAMNEAGQPLGEFQISGASFRDWEDLSRDEAGHLFLADSGNNDADRTEIAVHQIDEPDLTKATAATIPITRTWRLRFPGKPFDCESLFIWRGMGFLISKAFDDARAKVYRFGLAEDLQTLELLGELPIDSPVTGADLSRDGTQLGVVAKNGAYLFQIDGVIERAFSQKPRRCKFKHEHIEGCTFVPGGLLATAESREIYFFSDAAFERSAGKKK